MFRNIQGLRCSKARIVLVQQDVIPSNKYGKARQDVGLFLFRRKIYSGLVQILIWVKISPSIDRYGRD